MTIRRLALTVAGLTFCSTVFAQSFSGGNTIAQPAKSRFDPLADVILATVQPNTWDHVGGEASLQIVDAWGLAVISQTRAAHDEIEHLLATIRRVRLQQDGPHEDSREPPGSSAVEGHVDAAKRRKIEKALAEDVKLRFDNSPLMDVANHLSQMYRIPVMIDGRALEELGVTTDIPIDIDVSGVTLRSALHLMLRKHDLTYVYQDEVLVITSFDEGDTKLVTRVYPVRDLAANPHP